MLFNKLDKSYLPFHAMGELQSFDDAKLATDYIKKIYDTNIEKIRTAFGHFINSTDTDIIDNFPKIADANYPFLGIKVTRKDLNLDASLAYGVISEPGVYGGTLTRPDIFYDYYLEQISLLIKRHNVPVFVGNSAWPIPLPFAIDTHAEFKNSQAIDLSGLWQLDAGFVLPNLTNIDDDIANCTHKPQSTIKPISIFTGERVDYSLHRLHHYTGTSPEHFQGFILLTNYQRYADEFIRYGLDALLADDAYTDLILPGGISCKTETDIPSSIPLPQMPAYHLKRKDGMGITFINIGVGPSNAKNITDHLAVLRPHCWLMVGHCAGLRQTQILGDYVLAHGYVRDDNVLNLDLPIWVPVPPIAEVQVALQEAVQTISNQKGRDVKHSMRTGTVISTDDRNWELRTKQLYKEFRQSRAIALDMESATVAANGFRFRVPYGTLLCVSDKPIHGELKLRGMANQFYNDRVTQHLHVGLETMRILREKGVDDLHSRKLRGFDEPPFR
ncbi:AMP nucleosidase [Candidatus Odyssella acanthamoebae]|uniref:AMP nucleosidase n=1 Tax=Candidatus Odyssella acanthamoebae TaxID=91604 RepID=UPI0009FFB3BB|nr:AMP nucleosidase [Candidatus Paracaedibacter acanthamoebae]